MSNIKICQWCGKEYVPASSHQRFCKNEHHSICKYCGKTFIVDVTKLKMYCSEDCRNKGIHQKAAVTMMKKYGATSAMGCPELRSKIVATNLQKYGFENPAKSDKVKTKISEAMQKKPVTSKIRLISDVVVKHDTPEFAAVLSSSKIDYSSNFMIRGEVFDFKLADKNILIDIDPTLVHSNLDPKYHKEKSLLAAKHGYRCIHVFDWDRWEDIIDLISPKKVIYARNCKIKEIDKDTADKFISENHIQGQCKGATILLGLYFNSELVEVMTFGRPRYSDKYEYELLRLCTRKDLQVVGGASKLYSHFMGRYQPKSVMSYCDLAKFDGSVYLKLGMHLDHVTEPAKVWSKGNSKITDNLLRQRGFDALFRTDYGKGTSNEELMIKHNWLPVCDCGQAVFVWKEAL